MIESIVEEFRAAAIAACGLKEGDTFRVETLDLTYCEGDLEGIRVTLDLVHTGTGDRTPVVLHEPALYCRHDPADAGMVERVATHLHIPWEEARSRLEGLGVEIADEGEVGAPPPLDRG